MPPVVVRVAAAAVAAAAVGVQFVRTDWQRHGSSLLRSLIQLGAPPVHGLVREEDVHPGTIDEEDMDDLTVLKAHISMANRVRYASWRDAIALYVERSVSASQRTLGLDDLKRRRSHELRLNSVLPDALLLLASALAAAGVCAALIILPLLLLQYVMLESLVLLATLFGLPLVLQACSTLLLPLDSIGAPLIACADGCRISRLLPAIQRGVDASTEAAGSPAHGPAAAVARSRARRVFLASADVVAGATLAMALFLVCLSGLLHAFL
eukprot:TRINITY_DN34860_c0_g1_i1.p1 TRINITY_DN34860_c0_g1~~TRINITY_DN34860_c0_g1_i1.p1  ORF type:complete len:267 (-),score=55.79 TRINITY_DN34860_c0_g1_i1:147-947(-)